VKIATQHHENFWWSSTWKTEKEMVR
jgi:hypothetical protein